MLTPRWTSLRPHRLQHAYFNSKHRFNLNPSGRRSGKTELFKRKLVRAALRGTAFDNPRFFAGAPTRNQAKNIYWADLKALSPPHLRAGTPSEGELVIRFVNGSEIYVVGMDKPERIEGQPWDGGGLDEYGNMKEKAWPENVRPALSDRKGWCEFIGVPEGRNHYFDLYENAKAKLADLGLLSPWGVFEWESKDILDPEEIEAARRDLHPLMFEQEYGGKFVDFRGVAIFDLDKLLQDGAPVDYPAKCDGVFAIIDTAVKTGKENDGTGVIYYAVSKHSVQPLTILDWDLQQIEGALLEAWLPSVFQNLETFAGRCGARMGSLGAFIEDKSSGMVLLQHAARKNWDAKPIPETLTALGKDERALSVSGYHYSGKCKISRAAHEKTTVYKGKQRNHLLRQLADFRIGDPDAAKRADDLLDDYTYGLAIAFGNSEGF